MRRSFFAVLLTFSAVPMLSACGGTSSDDPIIRSDTGADEGTGTDSSTTDSSVSDTPTDTTTVTETSTETGSDGSSDAPDGDARVVCSTLPTRAACNNCCGDEHPTGEKEFQTAVIACACGPSVCKTECATTVCASPAKKADPTCQACLAASIRPGPADGGTAGACVGPVSSACTGDCKKYLNCIQSCSKP